MSPLEQIRSLLNLMQDGLYEKEHICAMALLCAVSGESCFLLGPPGTAKSEVSRRLKLIFRDARAFEYLMSRFSTPDEIFGPVSIRRLKKDDTYERCVDGFLPSADVVFLDEIWKAGPAIQNALLTAINERIYRNGMHTLRLPMKCLIAASNELPAEDEGLEALWDRFLVRLVSNPITDEKTFYKMLRMQQLPEPEVSDDLLLSASLLEEWSRAIGEIKLPPAILSGITFIRRRMAEEAKKEGVPPLDYYISDRRWRQCIHLMRTSAFLNDRKQVDWSDFMLLVHTLWNKIGCIEPVISMVLDAVTAEFAAVWSSVDAECEKQVKLTVGSAQGDITAGLKKFNYFYLGLKDHPNGPCLFYEADYKYVPTAGDCPAVLYYDTKISSYVIRRYDPSGKGVETTGRSNVQIIRIRRYPGALMINGTTYTFIRTGAEGEPLMPATKFVAQPLVEKVEKAIEELRERVSSIADSANPFVCPDTVKLLQKHAKQVDKHLQIVLSKAKNL